jgi:hypothetical protein
MSRITGGRITVRADGDPTLLHLDIMTEDLPEGGTRHVARLASGEECEKIDNDTWRVCSTGLTLRRAPTLFSAPALPLSGPGTHDRNSMSCSATGDTVPDGFEEFPGQDD